MFSRLKFEKALGALVLLTVVAIIGEREILQTRQIITPDQEFAAAVYDDDVEGGNSIGRLLSNKDSYQWRCTLRNQYAYPFCGFELLFDPNRENGLDFSSYDRIRLWLTYDGPSPTLRIYLRNVDPAYTIPGVNDSTKYNQIEFDSTSLSGTPIEFNMGDFFVANWWYQRFRIAPQLSHPQFDNIVILEIQTGNGRHLGEHRFELQKVELSGQRLTTLQWYQLIMAVWLGVALIYLGNRTWQLNRELRQRRQREQELLEINALLDMRGRELEELAKTDPLTGAFNRQGIKDAIKAGLTEWRREQKPLSILMIDIDHFKQVNDNHGHSVGDQILTSLTDMVQDNIRGTDVFARWGGEEFVLVCRDTPVDFAGRIAEKLRFMVASHEFAPGVPTTVSIGVASLGERESLDQLFIRADRALYEAKNEGRNRVVMANGNPPTVRTSAKPPAKNHAA